MWAISLALVGVVMGIRFTNTNNFYSLVFLFVGAYRTEALIASIVAFFSFLMAYSEGILTQDSL